jgi:7-cyano-7-deazaguanine synthase
MLSGGLDSASLLYSRLSSRTRALFVDYGQISLRGEERAARSLAHEAGVSLDVVRVPALAELGAGSLSGAAALGHADGVSELQKEEWFPARNLMLAAIAAIVLGRLGGGEIVFGAAAVSYRDARPEFFRSVEAVVSESLPEGFPAAVVIPSGDRLRLLRASCHAGLEPRLTFSCNRRGDRHCWRCSSCRDRRSLLDALSQGPSNTSSSPV